MIRRKLQPPGLPAGVISRPRLDELFGRLIAQHSTLAVFASAGSGKTVQAQMFAARFGWPLSWLTLDEADRSGNRLLFYLAESVRPFYPDAPRAVRDALSSGLSLAEVTAMLADSLEDRQFLIVLDDCESIAGQTDATSVLEIFLDYLPRSACAILLSRDELETPISRMQLEGRIGRVTDEDLALDASEARSMLAAQGQDDRDPAELIEATKGWVAAFAFGVRPEGADRGDGLSNYLNSEILGRLPEDEQRFLLQTSLLSYVSPQPAVRLCGPEAYGLWRKIRSRHLPATITADRSIVYHPRFRAFLREQLEAEYGAEIFELRRRHARVLEEMDLHEEAVSIYLELGDLDEATVTAESAVPHLIDRADWALLLKWFEALGEARVSAHPLLQGAQIRSLYGTRSLPEAKALIRALHANGELTKVVEADPGVVPYIGQSLQWRSAEALELLDTYPGNFYSEAIRFELQALSGRTPATPPRGTRWSDIMERIVSWGLLAQGRLDDLVFMLPDGSDWPPSNYFRTPHPLLGLVWRGELARARELLDEVPTAARQGWHSDFWYFHEAWLYWAEGDLESALSSAKSAVEHSSRTGFGWEPCFDVVVGFLLASLGQQHDARNVLASSLRQLTASRSRAYAEWALTFEGLSFLMDGQVDDAVRSLRRAMDGMRRSRRLLMMPFAGVFLAEAEWRFGNEEASIAVANEVYEAAIEMGALFILRRALEAVPDVVERQIAHDGGSDRWRRVQGLRRTSFVAPRPDASARSDGATTTIDIQPFGDVADLIVNGRPALVRRLKVIELASYLALHPGGVDRKQLQAKLFPETDQRHGGNHFRQVVHKLRFGTGIALGRTAGGLVQWPEGTVVDSVDLRFERMLAEASNLSGAERLCRLSSALELVRGPYLQDSDLEWVESRRFEFDVLRNAALAEAAEVALDLRRMDQARTYAEHAVAVDPYSEAAYRTLMRVEAAIGAPGAVLTVYRRLTEALAELRLEPDSATDALMHELRASA